MPVPAPLDVAERQMYRQRLAPVATKRDQDAERCAQRGGRGSTPIKNLLPYGIGMKEDCERSPCSWRLVCLQAFADARL